MATNEPNEGWVQDPDGNWHQKQQEKTVGKLGQIVVAIVIVVAALVGCAWWFNKSTDTKTDAKTASVCDDFPDLPSCS